MVDYTMVDHTTVDYAMVDYTMVVQMTNAKSLMVQGECRDIIVWCHWCDRSREAQQAEMRKEPPQNKFAICGSMSAMPRCVPDQKRQA